MPVQVEVEFPGDNEVALSPKFVSEGHGTVRVSGRGNVIAIADPFLPSGAHFVLTGGATVRVGANANLNHLAVHALAPGVVVELGAWVSFNGACQITAHEPSHIRIGAGCLFGGGCSIASSDVHKILDVRTGERLNPAADIAIGEHVWAAANVTILRGSRIGADSVIGVGSVVRGEIPANALAAGAPARVVREGIRWEF